MVTPSKTRAPRRRQTRSAATSDEDAELSEPVVVTRKTVRRVSVTALEPESEVPVITSSRTARQIHAGSAAQNGGYQHEENDETEHEEKPAVSERIKAAATHVQEQVHDTVSSALHKAAPYWKSVLPLLLLTMLTSYLTSRLAQPDLTKRQLSGILSSIDQAHGRYNSLLRELENAQGQVKATEDRLAKTLDKVDALEKQFAGADGSERKAFSRGAKVDPQVVLGLAEQRVEKLLTKFAADRTGLADFALHAAGGKVEGHSRLAYVPSQDTWSLWRRTSAALLPGAGGLVHPEADKFLLTPGGPVPGECLALNGSSGWVDIRLRQPIEPSALSYEHVPASINYDSSSAPLRISVTGRLEPAFRFAPYSSTPLLGQLERRPGLGPVPLGSFVYDPYNRGPLQTVGLNSDTVVDHIRFQVDKNYGHPEYTCIYRIRVHGRVVDEE